MPAHSIPSAAWGPNLRVSFLHYLAEVELLQVAQLIYGQRTATSHQTDWRHTMALLARAIAWRK